jgi:hypothetical protein
MKSSQITSLSSNLAKQFSKRRNYVLEFEEKLNKLFQLKYRHTLRNAFDLMFPNRIISVKLRKKYDELVRFFLLLSLLWSQNLSFDGLLLIRV